MKKGHALRTGMQLATARLSHAIKEYKKATGHGQKSTYRASLAMNLSFSYNKVFPFMAGKGCMLFKNYHVVIFKDREGGFRNLRLRGWFGFSLVAVIAGLLALNAYLWTFYAKTEVLEHELAESRRILQEQNSQMLGLSVKVDELSADLERIQTFDSRLRVLLNIDKETGSGIQNIEAAGEEGASRATLARPEVLMQHRDLFSRKAHALVSELSTNVFLEEISQQSLLLFLRENKETLLAMPSIWPATGRVTSGFGYRSSPFTGRTKLHAGLDVANKVGTPVWATARGIVTFANSDGAYGKSIIIDHGNNIVTKFAHLSAILVKEGQQVQRGEIIGKMGNSGRSTGPHLHYEVLLSGTPVNPMRYILN